MPPLSPPQYVDALPVDAVQVPGFPNTYVTRTGKIFSTQRRRIIEMRQTPNSAGYLQVRLVKGDGTRKALLVHRLLAELFIPGDKKLTVDHDDTIKNHNGLDNLKWLSRGDNTRKAIRLNPDRNTKISKTLSQSVTGVHKKTGETVKFESTVAASLQLAGSDNCSHICRSISAGCSAYGYHWSRP